MIYTVHSINAVHACINPELRGQQLKICSAQLRASNENQREHNQVRQTVGGTRQWEPRPSQPKRRYRLDEDQKAHHDHQTDEELGAAQLALATTLQIELRMPARASVKATTILNL